MAKRVCKRIRWSRLLLILLLSYFVYMYAGQESQLRVLDSQVNAAQERIQSLQAQHAAYEQERQLLQTDGYVEKVAREELGLVKPGETPYIPGK